MKIAIDCRAASDREGAGIAHYVRFLMRDLLEIDEENRYVLFFDQRATKAEMAEMLGASRNAVTRVVPLGRARKLLPYAWSHHVVAKAIVKEQADVFHAPSGSLPLGYKGPSVITVHDLAIYEHPEWFPGGQLFSKRIVVPASVERARRVIAVSHATKRDLIRRFAVPEEKVSVIYEGADFSGHQADEAKASPILRHGLKHPYFLYLGTVEPRKNVDGLVRAYMALAREFPKLVGKTELVIAGSKGWKSDRVFADIERANKRFKGKGPQVRYLGYVPKEDKLAIMAHALAFVFPSLYEGFGLPVLEAMKLGVPVVSSDISSIPEIVGRAGILIDPNDETELVLAMKHLLEDPKRRQELGRLGQARAVEFSWRRAAGETLEVYEAAAKGEVEHVGADVRIGWHGPPVLEEEA